MFLPDALKPEDTSEGNEIKKPIFIVSYDWGKKWNDVGNYNKWMEKFYEIG